jgi:NADH:ubiquinone oxidoreductase subunit 6 (subunit J)
MSRGRGFKRVYTVEAVVVGCLFAFIAGFLVGLAAALLTASVGIGVLVGAVMFLFSLDVMFNGTESRYGG